MPYSKGLIDIAACICFDMEIKRMPAVLAIPVRIQARLDPDRSRRALIHSRPPCNKTTHSHASAYDRPVLCLRVMANPVF